MHSEYSPFLIFLHCCAVYAYTQCKSITFACCDNIRCPVLPPTGGSMRHTCFLAWSSVTKRQGKTVGIVGIYPDLYATNHRF